MGDVGVGALEIGVGADVSDDVDVPVEALANDDRSFFNILVDLGASWLQYIDGLKSDKL